MYTRLLALWALFFCLMSCNSPATSDTSAAEHVYHDLVEVVYTRDLNITSKPDAPRSVILNYVLYDPSQSTYAEDEVYEYGYRSGSIEMENIGDDKFRAYLKHVLIHTGLPGEQFHWAFVLDDDEKIPKAIGLGIYISGATETELVYSSTGPSGSTELKFKMSEK